MSRLKKQFTHRTSVFEGAYRAWSYLGSFDLQILEDIDLAELQFKNKEFTHEPLPRVGLLHPFVTSILARWLGERSDKNDFDEGLTVLRKWWQNRRIGQSSKAREILGTFRMEYVVQSFTKDFFALALSLVLNYETNAPNTLRDEFKKLSIKTEYLKKLQRANDPSLSNISSNRKRPKSYHVKEKNIFRKQSFAVCDHFTNHPQNFLQDYGQQTNIPVIFRTMSSDRHIALRISMMNSVHSIKIIEMILSNTSNFQSPITGLMDVCACIRDSGDGVVLVRISFQSDPKYVVAECCRRLALVGYVTDAVKQSHTCGKLGTSSDSTRSIKPSFSDNVGKNQQLLSAIPIDVTATKEVSLHAEFKIRFDWNLKCSCPRGIPYDTSFCPKHSQLNVALLESILKCRVFDSYTLDCLNTSSMNSPTQPKSGNYKKTLYKDRILPRTLDRQASSKLMQSEILTREGEYRYTHLSCSVIKEFEESEDTNTQADYYKKTNTSTNQNMPLKKDNEESEDIYLETECTEKNGSITSHTTANDLVLFVGEMNMQSQTDKLEDTDIPVDGSVKARTIANQVVSSRKGSRESEDVDLKIVHTENNCITTDLITPSNLQYFVGTEHMQSNMLTHNEGYKDEHFFSLPMKGDELEDTKFQVDHSSQINTTVKQTKAAPNDIEESEEIHLKTDNAKKQKILTYQTAPNDDDLLSFLEIFAYD